MELLVFSLFAAALLVCVIFHISLLFALLLGYVIFALYAIRKGFSLPEVLGMSAQGVRAAKNILTTFVLIGILTSLWRAGGTIPAIVCYSVRVMEPRLFLVCSFLLNCLVSFLTGTAFGSAATMGAVCMTMAAALGADRPGLWQANARGVDLNHNYDAGWEALHRMEREAGITGPGPTRFGGPCPESEIETQLVTALCRRVPFRRALAFHSQGEEIYWNFGPCTPACAYPLGRVFAMSSGYLLSAPEGLAVGGGFKDWFLSCFGRPAYTVEIGRGKNPLPLSDLSAVYSRLEEMLLLSVLL